MFLSNFKTSPPQICSEQSCRILWFWCEEIYIIYYLQWKCVFYCWLIFNVILEQSLMMTTSYKSYWLHWLLSSCHCSSFVFVWELQLWYQWVFMLKGYHSIMFQLSAWGEGRYRTLSLFFLLQNNLNQG